ncbi:hypothetical protein [Gordonia tangerina]|jgi:hypothetical protein|uniref:Holin n=1 Tax=Gordonia tangerina TaxID=2911060 RepID=A0ABS9DQ30_9ACTN|nr:hypothetical protein [Gordonia tangerina]MCF3941312.1 hypothetical protein [Gordonia tangerina]
MSILKKLWAYEPVRLVLYSVIVAVVGYFVTRGVLNKDLADLLIIPAIAVVMGVPLTEVARSKVTPQVKVPDIITENVDAAVSDVSGRVDDAVAQARAEIEKRFGEQPAQVLDVVSKTVEGYIGRHRKS